MLDLLPRNKGEMRAMIDSRKIDVRDRCAIGCGRERILRSESLYDDGLVADIRRPRNVVVDYQKRYGTMLVSRRRLRRLTDIRLHWGA